MTFLFLSLRRLFQNGLCRSNDHLLFCRCFSLFLLRFFIDDAFLPFHPSTNRNEVKERKFIPMDFDQQCSFLCTLSKREEILPRISVEQLKRIPLA